MSTQNLPRRQKSHRKPHNTLDEAITKGITKARTHDRNVKTAAVRLGKDGVHLLIHKYSSDALAFFDRELNVMSTVAKMPAIVNHAPRIVHADRTSGVLVLSSPKRYWTPFWTCIETLAKFDLTKLLELKQQLRVYIELLYKNGVAYRVKPDFVFPAELTSGRWVLYLGGWMDAELCPDPSTIDSSAWKKEREAEQLATIEQLFECISTMALRSTIPRATAGLRPVPRVFITRRTFTSSVSRLEQHTQKTNSFKEGMSAFRPFGRAFAQVFLGGIFAYQLIYWVWMKLETWEKKLLKNEEMKVLEKKAKELAASAK